MATITGTNPSSAAVGASITINGTGFGSSGTVTWGCYTWTKPVTVNSWSDTAVSVVVPNFAPGPQYISINGSARYTGFSISAATTYSNVNYSTSTVNDCYAFRTSASNILFQNCTFSNSNTSYPGPTGTPSGGGTGLCFYAGQGTGITVHHIGFVNCTFTSKMWNAISFQVYNGSVHDVTFWNCTIGPSVRIGVECNQRPANNSTIYQFIAFIGCNMQPCGEEGYSFDGGYAACTGTIIQNCIIYGANNTTSTWNGAIEFNGPTYWCVADTTIYRCAGHIFNFEGPPGTNCGGQMWNVTVDMTKMYQTRQPDGNGNLFAYQNVVGAVHNNCNWNCGNSSYHLSRGGYWIGTSNINNNFSASWIQGVDGQGTPSTGQGYFNIDSSDTGNSWPQIGTQGGNGSGSGPTPRTSSPDPTGAAVLYATSTARTSSPDPTGSAVLRASNSKVIGGSAVLNGGSAKISNPDPLGSAVLTASAVRTNLIANPSFEGGTAGGSSPSGVTGVPTGWWIDYTTLHGTPTSSLSTSNVLSGTYSWHVHYVAVSSDTGNVGMELQTTKFPCSAGTKFTFQMSVYSTVSVDCTASCDYWDSNGNYVSVDGENDVTWGPGRRQCVWSSTVPAGATQVSPGVGIAVNYPQTVDVYIDCAMFEAVNNELAYYYDGNTVNPAYSYQWNGTANNSTTTRSCVINTGYMHHPLGIGTGGTPAVNVSNYDLDTIAGDANLDFIIIQMKSYKDTTNIPATQAEAIAAKARGLYVAWGITCDVALFTASEQSAYLSAITTYAQWCQTNHIDEFVIGNEFELSVDNSTFTVAAARDFVRQCASTAKSAGFTGKVSYKYSMGVNMNATPHYHSYLSDWTSDPSGLGSLDLFGIDIYGDPRYWSSDVNTYGSNLWWAHNVQLLASTYGSKGYISEFGTCAGVSTNWVSVVEAMLTPQQVAQDIASKLNIALSAGVTRISFFCWHFYTNDGIGSMQQPDGTFHPMFFAYLGYPGYGANAVTGDAVGSAVLQGPSGTSRTADTNGSGVLSTPVSGTFGNMTGDDTLCELALANSEIVTSVTLASAVTGVASLTMYVGNNRAGYTTQQCHAMGLIYADNSGSPGALVAKTTSTVTIAYGQAPGWVTFPFTPYINLAAGTYWLGIMGSSGATALDVGYTVGGTTAYPVVNTTTVGNTTGDDTLCEINFVGFELASPVTFATSQPNVTSLSMYVGNNRAGYTSQQCHIIGLIYADNSGSPGALVATTASATVTYQQAPGWVTCPFSSPVSLAAGNYWFAIMPSAGGTALDIGYTNGGTEQISTAVTYPTPIDPYAIGATLSRTLQIYATCSSLVATYPTPLDPFGTVSQTLSRNLEIFATWVINGRTGDKLGSASIRGSYSNDVTGSAILTKARTGDAVGSGWVTLPSLNWRVSPDILGSALLGVHVNVLTADSTGSATLAQSTQTFGNTVADGTLYESSVGGKTLASSVTLAGPANGVNALWVYLTNSLTGYSSQQSHVLGLIYADNSGSPGALVAQTVLTLVPYKQPFAWVCCPFASPLNLSAGTYWLGVLSSSGATAMGLAYTSGGAEDIAAGTANYPTPLNPFGSVASSSAQSLEIFGTVGSGRAADTVGSALVQTPGGRTVDVWGSGVLAAAPVGSWRTSDRRGSAVLMGLPPAGQSSFEILCRAPFTPLTFSCTTFAGDTIYLQIPTSFGGSTVDLSGTTLYFAVAAKPGGTVLLEKVFTPSLPTYVPIQNNETMNLGKGTWYYEMEFRDVTGLVATVQTGYITLSVNTA